MSMLSEYVNACCGYDEQGRPASMTQITFGLMPFAVSEGERIEDFTQITTACQTDAIVSLDVVDSIAKLELDFSLDTETFANLINEIDFYKEQLAHVTNTLAVYEEEFNKALEAEDDSALEEIDIKFRSTSVPFMIPTIVPTAFGGDVHVSFAQDPKFIFFSSDKPNQYPSKLIMIFDATALFAEDETAVYDTDAEEEIRMQQEEMFYAEEARKIEEAEYQSKFGFSRDDDDDETDIDPRAKGLRFK